MPVLGLALLRALWSCVACKRTFMRIHALLKLRPCLLVVVIVSTCRVFHSHVIASVHNVISVHATVAIMSSSRDRSASAVQVVGVIATAVLVARRSCSTPIR
eukprot:10084815-Alexandrium_andersonii.AAC.1